MQTFSFATNVKNGSTLGKPPLNFFFKINFQNVQNSNHAYLTIPTKVTKLSKTSPLHFLITNMFNKMKIVVVWPFSQKNRASTVSIIRPNIGVHITSRTEHYIRYRGFGRKKSSETRRTNLSLVEIIANFIRSKNITKSL